jgi:alkylation response protein AidB-like acyl-CoA dehydrogenase
MPSKLKTYSKVKTAIDECALLAAGPQPGVATHPRTRGNTVDTSFATEDIAFRDEVRAFFAQAYDEELQGRLASREPEVYKQAVVEWQKRLQGQGWIAPGWPVEHGGTDWNATRSFIYESERAAAGVRDVVPFGLKMVGPLIYTFGTDEQKERFLPSILASDDWW